MIMKNNEITKNRAANLYFMVKYFLSLSYRDRFNLGLDFRAISEIDYNLEIEEMDERIIRYIYQNELIDDFINEMYTLSISDAQ